MSAGPTFADQVRAIMDAEGLSQGDVAAAVGRTERTVRFWLGVRAVEPRDAVVVLGRLRERFPGE